MGESLRMVHLRTVPDAWHARVLAARLGCEGIVTHLEGNLAGPYPFGSVRVLVEADQAELAAELLLADEVEAAFASEVTSTAVARAGGPKQAMAGGACNDLGIETVNGGTALPSCELGSPSVHPTVRLRRAAAALIALAIAGAGVLAHFVS